MPQCTSEKSGPSLLYLPIRWMKEALRSSSASKVIQYIAYCWINISRTWMKGWVHPLQFCELHQIEGWVTDTLMGFKKEKKLLFTGKLMGWRDRLTVASWSSAEANVKSYSRESITSCSAKGWGPTRQKAALQEITSRPWSTGFTMSQQWALTAKTKDTQAVLARI